MERVILICPSQLSYKISIIVTCRAEISSIIVYDSNKSLEGEDSMKRGKRYLRTICAFLIAIGVLAGCDNKESVSEDVSVDTSWYESSKTTFTLTKASQLMGLAELSQKNDFKGKTIKLGADIFLNKVDSTTIRQ